jgi:uncharacterized protein (DUF302 family)
MNQERYYFSAEIKAPFEKAIKMTREALAAEGFGVLTEIDVKDTLKKKLDADFRPYVILGACNPPLAHRSLQADEQIGLLLPCNVVVQESAGGVIVSAINPEVVMDSVKMAKVEAVACEVGKKLKNVIMSLERA